MTSAGQRLHAGATSLLQPGRIEILLAGLLALMILIVEPATGQPVQNIVIDLIACALTVVAVRWPRAGGLAVAAFLALRLAIPWNYRGQLGEYAPLFTLLGVGMRGDFRLRGLLTVLYLPLMWLVAWSPNRPMPNYYLGSLVWVTIVGIVWLVGNAFYAMTQAQRQARAAELLLQRQLLARELHDTVARSFTEVVMTAERARLRGAAGPAELEQIAEAAAAGVDELRMMMSLMRDPATTMAELSGGTSLEEALAEAQRTLARDGFTPAISISGGLDRLEPSISETLAAVTSEAVANIVRHGDPAQPAGIVVDVDDQRASVAFINTTRPGHPSSADPLGLWGMRQRVQAHDGNFQAGPEEEHWVTRVRLPLSAQGLEREAS